MIDGIMIDSKNSNPKDKGPVIFVLHFLDKTVIVIGGKGQE